MRNLVRGLAIGALSTGVAVGATVALADEDCTISPAPDRLEASVEQPGLHPVAADVAGAHTGFHGQGLYGDETLYFSHLPVFMGAPEAHPHNFQVLLQVEIADPDALDRYRADRAAHPQALYTAVPPRFAQGALLGREGVHEPLTALAGSAIFRGHFEQGGPQILQDVPFEVVRVVHFREFEREGPRFERQRYLLFGRDQDLYLAHLLSAPPDFDQILATTLEVEAVPSDHVASVIEGLLADGMLVELSGRANDETTRLRPGETVTCALSTGTRALDLEATLVISAERYCESGEFDALVVDRFNPPRRCAD